MSGHKFKVCQLVYYLRRGGAYGVYQVTQLLPAEDEGLQYRIKSVNEPHERVVKEHELRSAVLLAGCGFLQMPFSAVP